MCPSHDRVDQVAFVLHQAQRAFKVRFSGMQIQRLAQNVHALVQVRFSLYPAIYGSDEGRAFLPLVLFDVVFESLEDGDWRDGRQAFVVLALEVFWQSVIEGILAPGFDYNNSNLPWFHVTAYGRQVIASTEPQPYAVT